MGKITCFWKVRSDYIHGKKYRRQSNQAFYEFTCDWDGQNSKVNGQTNREQVNQAQVHFIVFYNNHKSHMIL